MPNIDKTEIVVILDRSGSMQKIKADMEGGFETFIDKQKAEPGECLVSLYQFDDKYEVVYEGRPIAEVGKLNLVPRSTTALLDAVGKSLANTAERFAKMDEADRAGAVVLMVITDGQENDSHEWELAQVRDALKDAEDVRKWQVVFMAADAGAFKDAQAMGIKGHRLGMVDKSAAGVRSAYAATSEGLSEYRKGIRTRSADPQLKVDKSKLDGKN